MNALEIRNLSKSFGKLKAVDNVSFDVPEGSIFGLIGRNGAGKTTTIRMMMNIYLPDSGEVKFRGTKIGRDFKNRVGYLPEERGLYKKMTVWDTLMFFSELKGKKGPELQKKAKRYLERFDLLNRKNDKVEDLSKGNQQKIQFIATILHEPDFIILDEPFAGLDPINTNLLKNIVLELKQKGKVVILSTHLMDFAERMCDHIAMIDHAKIILKGALSEIKKQFARKNISLVYEGDISFLETNEMVEQMDIFGNTTSIRIRDSKDAQAILKILLQRNIIIKKFDANDISLHEIFINLAGDEEATQDV